MHKRSLGNKKKAYLFQNWFYPRILKVSWIATKAIISLENLGTEVPRVDCDVIPEGIKMARSTDNLSVTEASSWQGKWETETEGRLALMCSFTQ